MLSIKKFILHLNLLMLVFYFDVNSQNQIYLGTVSNGGGKQSNSSFIILGSAGQISIDKSSNSINQAQPGFWSNFTEFNYPTTLPLNTNYTFNDATQTSSYRMIGIPGANNIPISSLMSGTEGKNGDWRAFLDPGSGDYLEYDGSSKFNYTPGNAFWIVSKNAININQTVNTVPLSSDNSFSISLHEGWNLISNPFEKNIAWTDIKNINSITQPIQYYQSGSYNSNINNFEPYKGYYYFNNTGLTALKIPYLSLTNSSIKKTHLQTVNKLVLVLDASGVKKSAIAIGFSSEADLGEDKLDIFSPPSQFCKINMSLYNEEIQRNYKFLEEEYRQEIGRGQEYRIFIKNTSNETLELTNKGSEYFGDFEICLLDKSQIKFYDLKNQNSIEIKSSAVEKEYELFIGTEDYMIEKKKSLLPAEYALYQNYPNPFNPSTTIKFALPQQNKVSLSVFNILGELVVKLINDEQFEAGYHQVIFENSSLASGVYIYRLMAGDYIGTKKMLIIK